jgi:hypothetical protein
LYHELTGRVAEYFTAPLFITLTKRQLFATITTVNPKTNMSHNYDHDHMPELALNGGALAMAEEFGLPEQVLASSAERRHALAELPPHQLLNAVIGLNATMRGLKPGEGVIEDGILPSMATPPLEDKEPLLLETVGALQTILSDASLDDATSLRRAGLTLAGGLNFIHPFGEGNGRTSRVAQYFIEFGNERGPELFEAETYSAIGKIAVFDIDIRMAVDTTPHKRVEHALDDFLHNTRPELIGKIGKRQAASEKVRLFLAAMEGEQVIPMPEGTDAARVKPGTLAVSAYDRLEGYQDGVPRSRRESITFDGPQDLRTVYEGQYVNSSFAAHVPVSLIPPSAQRISGSQRPDVPMSTLYVDIVS